jgi:hypothetical protein
LVGTGFPGFISSLAITGGASTKAPVPERMPTNATADMQRISIHSTTPIFGVILTGQSLEVAVTATATTFLE